jgi:hypothetical protein
LRAGFDIKGEDVTDGVAVFGAVQAVDDGVARVGVSGGVLIELGPERGGEGLGGDGVRAREAGGRHLIRGDFAEDLFPDGGVGTGFGRVEVLEGDAGGFELVVVAGDAVLGYEGAALIDHRGACGSLGGLPGEERRGRGEDERQMQETATENWCGHCIKDICPDGGS